MHKLDIVIPVLNESRSLSGLISRTEYSLKKHNIPSRVIVVDDHSSDNTTKVVGRLLNKYPITFLFKQGKRGKAYSILEGCLESDAEYIAMIDGDLQYAPEYIAKMLKKAETENLGIVIGNRKINHENILRRFISLAGHYIYGKLILGLNIDTQSGLKLFRREIVSKMELVDLKPWAFDLPLIYTAKQMGMGVGSIDINFRKRKLGKSKINFIRSTWEILTTAISLRLKGNKVFHLEPESKSSMLGAGVFYKKHKYITHTTLHHSKSAVETFNLTQKIVIMLVAGALTAGLILNPHITAVVFIAILSLIYFLDVLFSLFLVLKSLHYPPEIKITDLRLNRIKDENLPIYSILCPLYHEAKILPQFVENIGSLDWPKQKLDVMLLLEEEDEETIQAARNMNLPAYFRILIVPDSQPKTKPKACNYGLALARGEYVVIYDAEDAPEPKQLKKAFLAFQNAAPDVFCLQAKLNYYNSHQNILTRIFTAEYSLWFDVVLPGLQSIQTSIPLGGTSNHFRTLGLRKVEGWDPFNVTEDADLGARLFRAGFKTEIFDSVTLEEANSDVKNWIRQRSRWLKGYMQTYLVQMRNPLKFVREEKEHYFIFQLVSGLRISFMLINPFLWAMTAAYFLLYKFVGPQIESLYPTSVFYIAIFSAVFGNFLYILYYMIGAAKKEQWDIIKYIYLVPFYWLLTSIGAFVAIYQLIFMPHFWEKTVHGLHFAKTEKEVIKFAFLSHIKDLGITGYGKVRRLATPEYISGAGFVAAILFGNFFSFLYNAYLGRKLPLSDFGLISLFGSFIYISQIITSALGRTFTHKSAYLFGKYGGPVKELWFAYRSKLIAISFFITVLWVIASPFLVEPFKSNDILPFLIFTPVWIMAIVGSIDISLLTGSLKFWIISLIVVVEPLAKFIFTVGFIQAGYHDLVYLAIPLSMLFTFGLGYLAARRLKGVTIKVNMKVVTSFPKKYFASSVVGKLATVVFLSLDLVAAKIFLTPSEAGNYALVSTVGKMVFFLSTLFGQFIIPYASKDNGEGAGNNKTFITIFSLTGLSTFFGVLVFGILGTYTAPILMGPKAYAITQYLPLFCLGIAFHAISSSLATYYQAKKRYAFPVAELIFSSVTIIGILFFHTNIFEFTLMMFVGGIADLGGVVLLYIFYPEFKTISRNLLDLFGLFNTKPIIPQYGDDLKILIFNWRDTKHVWAGGAEVYVHELAKRWVKKGYSVTLFCGNDGKNPSNEVIDGIQIIRRGGFYTVFIWAFLYYIVKFRNKFKVIIDAENGIPFFTPLYAHSKRIFLLVHHVHQEVFRIRFKPPISWIGLLLERYLVPLVYRNTEAITVSPSSKADILEYGLTKKEPHVIYNGVDTSVYKPGIKSVNPMVLYLGRLAPQKTLSVFIKSAKKILSVMPKVKFVIAGDGLDKERLMRLAKSIGLDKKITFMGTVTEKQKVNLYQKAWVFVNPSLIEGWGITSIEANACGTPVVASNVAGLRDSVKNPHSGFLVPYGNVDAFAKVTTKLLVDGALRKQMSKESVAWAKEFDWDKSAEHFLEHI